MGPPTHPTTLTSHLTKIIIRNTLLLKTVSLRVKKQKPQRKRKRNCTIAFLALPAKLVLFIALFCEERCIKILIK
jgi:hypothetical protein